MHQSLLDRCLANQLINNTRRQLAYDFLDSYLWRRINWLRRIDRLRLIYRLINWFRRKNLFRLINRLIYRLLVDRRRINWFLIHRLINRLRCVNWLVNRFRLVNWFLIYRRRDLSNQVVNYAWWQLTNDLLDCWLKVERLAHVSVHVHLIEQRSDCHD